MNPLRVPIGTSIGGPGHVPVRDLNLNVTCHVVCDMCGRARSKGNHAACSRARQALNRRP
jgi:hypothetical protein